MQCLDIQDQKGRRVQVKYRQDIGMFNQIYQALPMQGCGKELSNIS